jgi:hypothetical protein
MREGKSATERKLHTYEYNTETVMWCLGQNKRITPLPFFHRKATKELLHHRCTTIKQRLVYHLSRLQFSKHILMQCECLGVISEMSLLRRFRRIDRRDVILSSFPTLILLLLTVLYNVIIIISLLMSPLLGHRPSLWITHKENGP